MIRERPGSRERRFTFDDQAADFDRRAGLPANAARRIAAAVEDLAGAGAIVDVGAGTGEIGARLARCGRPYVGLDRSLPMLARFRAKLAGDTAGALLVRADAGRPWPIAGGRAGAIFLSRAAHLLDPARLAAEAERVAAAGAVLVLGGVRREGPSLRAELRRELHRLLAEHGVEARDGRRARREIVAFLERRGARAEPARTAASWPVVESGRRALVDWRSKSWLAGRSLPLEIRDTVLIRLTDWTRQRYGSLDVTRLGTESYRLAVVRWPEE